MSETTHVDDWIHGGDDVKPEDGDIVYARWMMLHFRLPATLYSEFGRFIKDKKLFCTYEGKRYRCTGGSRLGDVWLTTDFYQSMGYTARVDVSQCTHWSDKEKA